MPTKVFGLTLLAFSIATAAAEAPKADTSRGDRMLADYFRFETARLADDCLRDINTLDDWKVRREGYRRQLFEMLGLDPLPQRTPLEAKSTGAVDHPDFTVEKIAFQSRPGLYVTANLYVPKQLTKPAPAILYVCGHGNIKKNGVSYGSKTALQHHPGWFARHGYVCLILDTLQLGEIEGLHHGIYREQMWWWNCRGYTPAGVEAWNCIRALDYLQSRKEVDAERIGVTGRSGGGAYSWWIAALDERIKVAVPVAGIADLQNHVVDGCVEGHCDCMFLVNTYRWDYAQVAALIAPRPLLLANTDKDPIFPLDGVQRIHERVRKIYRLYGADDQFGLQISEGGHKDIQELQVAALRWFNRFLMHEDPLIKDAAEPLFEPEQLKVFSELPADQLNTQIHETFTAVAPAPSVPENAEQWSAMRTARLKELSEKCFRGWPSEPGPLEIKPAFDVEHDGLRLSAHDFTSQANVRLRLYRMRRAGLERPDLAVLNVLDDKEWALWLAAVRTSFAKELSEEQPLEPDAKAFAELSEMHKNFKWEMAFLAPRGVGPTAWDAAEKKQIQNRRRFMLLGQTLAGMQVWDVRRGTQALRSLLHDSTPLWLQGHRQAAGLALYASLFEPDIARLDLWQLPSTHRNGPYFLNVLRYLDTPVALTMAAEHSQVRLYGTVKEGVENTDWNYPAQVAARLGWNAKQLQLRNVPAER